MLCQNVSLDLPLGMILVIMVRALFWFLSVGGSSVCGGTFSLCECCTLVAFHERLTSAPTLISQICSLGQDVILVESLLVFIRQLHCLVVGPPAWLIAFMASWVTVSVSV